MITRLLRRVAHPLGQINGYVSEEFSASDYLDVQRIRAVLQSGWTSSSTGSMLAGRQRLGGAALVRQPTGGGRGRRDEVNQKAPDGTRAFAVCPP